MSKEKSWYLAENEKRYNGDVNRIEADKRFFFEQHADLFLVAKCLELKKTKDVVLITEESPNEKQNFKLYKKIPTICRQEGITYGKVPNMLFDIYSSKLCISASLKK